MKLKNTDVPELIQKKLIAFETKHPEWMKCGSKIVSDDDCCLIIGPDGYSIQWKDPSGLASSYLRFDSSLPFVKVFGSSEVFESQI